VLSTTNERTQRSNAALVRRRTGACVKQDSSHAVQQLRNSLGAEPQFVGLPWVRSLRGHLPVPPPRERDGCASVAPESDIDVHVCSSPVGSPVAVMLDQLTVRPSTESAVKMCEWQSLGPSLFKRAGHTGFSSWRRSTRGTCNCQACGWLAAVVVVVASMSLSACLAPVNEYFDSRPSLIWLSRVLVKRRASADHLMGVCWPVLKATLIAPGLWQAGRTMAFKGIGAELYL
jgi:hypothetical protein